MRAKIHKDICIGCGMCASICPEVFVIQDDEKAEVIAETTPANADSVGAAMENCPVAAIGEEIE